MFSLMGEVGSGRGQEWDLRSHWLAFHAQTAHIQSPPPIPLPKQSRHTTGERSNLPSNLLDDLTDESRALAQVTLGAGHTGLGDAGSRLLYRGKTSHQQIIQGPSSARQIALGSLEKRASHHPRGGSRDPPRGETLRVEERT